MMFSSEYLLGQLYNLEITIMLFSIALILLILIIIVVFVLYSWCCEYCSSKGTAKFAECYRDEYLEFKESPTFNMLDYTPLAVNDPDLLRFILAKDSSHFQDYGLCYNENIDAMGVYMFQLVANEWQNSKNKFSPTRISGEMKRVFSMIEETGRELAEGLVEAAKDGEPVEVEDLMFRYSLAVIIWLGHGMRYSLQHSTSKFLKWGEKICKFIPLINAFVGTCSKVGKFFKMDPNNLIKISFIAKFKKSVKYMMANNVVRKGYAYSHDGLARDIPDNFEISTTITTYCLYELSLHQDSQNQLAHEINRVLKKFRGLTYEGVNAMPYLHKVVSETLRKYPPIPFREKICKQDTDLPGINLRIPKNTSVMIVVLGIHFDPNIYPEPDKFDPERFNEENIARRHPYTYLPFGEACKNCIGMSFGLLQTKIALISLLSKYRLKPGPNMEVPLQFDKRQSLLIPNNKITLRFENR